MEFILRNLRYGFRILWKSPSFTFISVLALALGIGAVTTMFSVINGSILKDLPFPGAERLMLLKRWNVERTPWESNLPVSEFEDLRSYQTSFTDLSGWYTGTVNLSYRDNPVRLTGARIYHTWNDILGVQPIIGRGFTESEDRRDAPPVVLLSYATWQTHFGGEPSIVGQPIRINGSLGEVVGVMPEGFKFPMNEDCWIPLMSSLDFANFNRGEWGIEVMGKLKHGVSLDQANAEMTTFIQNLGRVEPELYGRFVEGSVERFASTLLGEEMVRTLSIMLAMAFFVLLIACANVANLLLARSAIRSKELAIRSSLGASRRSIMGQLLLESIAMAILGAVGGLLISLWATHALIQYGDVVNMPYWFDFGMDVRVFLVVTAVTLLAGILSGLLPAIRASKVSVTEILKDDTRTGSSMHMGFFSKLLVVIQVAISCILLIATVLMMRSVDKVKNTDLHFDTDTVFTARMGLFGDDYPSEESRFRFFETLQENLKNRPEIKSTAVYSRYRWTNTGLNWNRVMEEGSSKVNEEDHPLSTSEFISPGYFSTLGVSLTKGREFNVFDLEEGIEVVIINESLAKTLFPNEEPIGKRIQRVITAQELAAATREEDRVAPWLSVIGIAPDMAPQGIGNVTPANNHHYWLPLAKDNAPSFLTIAATPHAGDPMRLNAIIREEVIKLDPNLPLYAVATPAKIIEEDIAGNLLIANIFKIFGMVAVFLASVGIYGVMSFSVNQRIQEFGIRSALGASARNILLLVLRLGFVQFIIGLGFGLVGAFFLAKAMQSMLFGVSSQDPLTFVTVSIIFTLVALSACIFPARKAAMVHPAQALRYE